MATHASAAEADREERIKAMSDDDALAFCLGDDTLSDRERSVFEDMSDRLDRGFISCLSKAQRAWVEDALRRIVPLDSKLVPVGRPVVTPAVLLNLPKKPPGRK